MRVHIIQERIRERLKILNLSGNEASNRADIGMTYVNDILNGRSKRPQVGRLSRLADALDCDVEYLLGDSNVVSKRADLAPISDVQVIRLCAKAIEVECGGYERAVLIAAKVLEVSQQHVGNSG